MPSVRAVVVPASRLECVACSVPRAVGEIACAACGAPYPPLSDENYFGCFGLEPRFAIDLAPIERRFLSWSKLLHPDRFAARGGQALQASIERMSFLNRALATLRSPERRREYLLALKLPKAPPAPPSRGVSTPLAAEWFELSDAIESASSEERSRRITEFVVRIDRERAARAEEIARAEALFDASGEIAPLESIRSSLLESQTLESLKRDVVQSAQLR